MSDEYTLDHHRLCLIMEAAPGLTADQALQAYEKHQAQVAAEAVVAAQERLMAEQGAATFRREASVRIQLQKERVRERQAADPLGWGRVLND